MGKGGQAGSRAGKRSDGEKDHREAELIRCCDGFVSLCLMRSPHPSPFVSLSFTGVPRSAAKKKNIIRLHLTSPLLNFVHVLLWMIRVLKASVQVITFCFVFLNLISFCLFGCLCGNMAFFIASIQHPEPCISFSFFFFYFLHFDVCLPRVLFRGRWRGRV